MNKQTGKNVIWNVFGSVFYSGCQWLLTILVVHLNSYEAAGYMSIAMTMSSSFSAISLFGMRNFQVSDVKGEYSQDEYVGSRIITCIAAFVLCTGATVFRNSPYQSICVTAFMLVRVAEGLVDVLHGENQKFERYDLIGKSFIIRGIITVASFVVISLITDRLYVALMLMAVLNLLVALVFDVRSTSKLERIHPVFFTKKVSRLLLVCAPIVVFSFLLSIENLIPKTVLQELSGTEKLGIYSSMASPTLVVQVAAQVAFNPFLPSFSKMYNDGDIAGCRRLIHRLYLVFVGLAVLVNIGAMLLGKLGLTILFGKDILKYYNLFIPIVWVTIGTAIIWIMSAILTAMRKIWLLLLGMVADFVMLMLLVRPFIERFDMNGVSLVQILASACYIIFMCIVFEAITIRMNGSIRG